MPSEFDFTKEHTPITRGSWRGFWQRQENNADVPEDHLIDLVNMNSPFGQLVTREGSLTSHGLGFSYPNSRIESVYPINDPFTAGSVILSYYDGAVGGAVKLGYYNNITPSFNDLTAAAFYSPQFVAVDFHGRYYICWINTDEAGGGPKDVLVVDTSVPNARVIAGASPAGATLACGVAGAGNVERGTHIYRVCYETASGYISPPSSTQLVAHVCAGAESHNLAGVPVGPAGTVARVIVTTKSIPRYNGDTENQEYFFVPNGRIPDNVTVFLNGVNYFDADLVESADYLFDQYMVVNSGRDMILYNNRLVIATRNRGVLVSVNGLPESFDQIDGVLDIREVYALAEYHGSLYMFARNQTYVTTDNGDLPSTWEVTTVDAEKSLIINPNAGVSLSSYYRRQSRTVAAVKGEKGLAVDAVLVANQSGVWVFRGYYETDELTWKIRRFWNETFPRVDASSFSVTSYVRSFTIDNVKKKIYIQYNKDNETTGKLLIGDFSNGLDAKNIQWTKYSIEGSASSQNGSIICDMFSWPLSFNAGGIIIDAGAAGFASAQNVNAGVVPNFLATFTSNIQADLGGLPAPITRQIQPQTVVLPYYELEEGYIHHTCGADIEIDDQSNPSPQWTAIFTGNLPNSLTDTTKLINLGVSTSRVYSEIKTNFKASRFKLTLSYNAAVVTTSVHTLITSIKVYVKKLWKVTR